MSLGKLDKCYARWKMLTPTHWSYEKIKSRLEAISKISEFNILFVYDGSLIVDTSFVLHQSLQPKKFYASIVDFLKKFVHICKIQTTVKAAVDVEITFSRLPFKGEKLFYFIIYIYLYSVTFVSEFLEFGALKISNDINHQYRTFL